jgi:hypothetical protein
MVNSSKMFSIVYSSLPLATRKKREFLDLSCSLGGIVVSRTGSFKHSKERRTCSRDFETDLVGLR